MGSKVTGVEHITALVKQSIQNISANHKELLETKQVRIICADARKLVAPEGCSFDAIHCGAAAEELPAWMWKAVKPGGRIVMPIGPEHGPQYLSYVDKNKEQSQQSSTKTDDGSEKIKIHKLFKVLYVPMTDPKWQKDRWEFIEVDKYDDDDDNDHDDDDHNDGDKDGR